jgi:hypothetical protein
VCQAITGHGAFSPLPPQKDGRAEGAPQ